MILETTSLFVLLAFAIYASVSDIRSGIIKNRILLGGAAYAVIANLIYYTRIAPELFPAFALNALSCTAIACVLFYTHAWAGGDCKLLCVFCLLYPAGRYLTYSDHVLTLPFSILITFVIGYLYLLASFIGRFVQKQVQISSRYIKNALYTFLRSYVVVLIYLTLFHFIWSFTLVSKIELRPIELIALDFCIVWLVSSVKWFKNRYLCLTGLVIDVGLSIALATFPLGTNLLHYLFVFIVILMRILIATQSYQVIQTALVRPGMILSTASSMQFIASRVKGLPGISTEDLRSRLTEEQAESIKRWEHSAKGQPQIIIVRKIPFAIFISLGFVLYYLLWRVIE